jgi:SPP1 gp7 family putative phage head morphogenesis protein
MFHGSDKMTEDEDKIEELLLLLLLFYRSNLRKAVTKASMQTTVEAVKSLQKARKKAGLEEITIDTKMLAKEALVQSEEYYSQLVKKGGSYVVEDGKLVFKPWLQELEKDTREKLLVIKSLSPDEIRASLSELKKSGENRAKIASEYEILRNVDAIKKNIWKWNDVQKVVWCTVRDWRVCPECDERDGEVYDLDDCPVLPHHSFCRCYYIEHFEKEV